VGVFLWLLCESQTRAATGHRQGLYLKIPHLNDAGFFLLCELLFGSQTRIATSTLPTRHPGAGRDPVAL
jgi:hypothetical protein